MIRRRSVIAGICSLVAAPSAVRAFFTTPVSATSLSTVERTTGPGAALTMFKIHGWDQNDPDCPQKAGQHVVVIHLTNSWRSAWL
jgi:hypothetical protein